MIKLVAADMDGTLLNSNKQLTAYTAQTLQKLYEQNIYFVAASGRQYYNLLDVFCKQDVKENMAFLAENGTLVFEREQLVFVSELQTDLIQKVIKITESLVDVYPVLCGVKAAYYADDDPRLKFHLSRYFARRVKLNCLTDVFKQDKIVKVAVLDADCKAESRCYKALKQLEDKAQVLLAGSEWVDVINHGVGKGRALSLIARRRQINFDEIMAFGDYLNDLDMMQSCKYSFAMANAHPELKQAAAYVCGSNDEDGVAKTLVRWLNL